MSSRFWTCLGLSLSLNYGALKHGTIVKVNVEMKKVHNMIVDARVKLRHFPRASLLMNLGTVYILISEILVCLLFVTRSFKGESAEDEKERDRWVETFCSSGLCDFSQLSKSQKRNWYFADLFLYTLSTVSSGVFICTIYGHYCLSIISFSKSTSAALKRYNQADLEAPLTRDFVLKCRYSTQAIKHVLRLCNEIFSGMFVIWFGVSLLCTCEFLSSTLKNFHKSHPFQIGLSFFIYGQTFLGVVIVSWVSSKFPNMFNKALVEMQTLTLNRRHVSLDVFAELNILLTQIQSHPTGIEIGGCFLITKAFFVSYLGTIVTFLMIRFQFDKEG